MKTADAAAVAMALPFPELVDALEKAFLTGFSAPPRVHHGVPAPGEPERTLLLMPAWNECGLTVVKVANIVPGNGARGLPAVMAQVLVSDAATGEWLCALDGGELTARRTAAASALASRYLSRDDSSVMFMVGAGRLSRNLIMAHASQRPIRHVMVWARRASAAAELVEWARGEGFEAVSVDLETGTRHADIISTATLSERPLVLGERLRPGVHLDLVGAFRPLMRETDAEAVALSDVFVDTRAGASAEAGDLIQAARARRFDFRSIRGDLTDLCRRRGRPARRSRTQITLFKSVGASVEDFVAARMAAARLK